MRIIIEGASPAFETKLLQLLDEHRHELTVSADTEWTTERATRFLRDIPLAARTFVRRVVEGGGWADADELRAEFESLRGPTIALARALPRGVRQGHWPEGTPAPVAVVYDPDNPSWQRAIGYQMVTEHLRAFQAAFARLDEATG